MANEVIHESMIQPRGPAYRANQIASHSHYNDPIDQSPGRAAGNSRIWGDASPETQSRTIDALIASGERAGLNPREIGHVLAIARVESGFNPDAAAGTTSAFGLGQFIDRTGASYGVNDANRNDLHTQTDALVAHYRDNAALARTRGQGEDYIYKYHHDGPSGEYGGLDIAEREVTPHLNQYEQFVREHQRQRGVEPLGPSTVQRPGGNAHGNHAAHGAVLHEGSHSPAVSGLQTQLRNLGYTGRNNVPLTPDSHFGPDTRRAVETFQRDHNLQVDGRAGPATLGKLRELSQQQTQTQPAHPLMLLSDAHHPGHALFKQAQASVHKLDAQQERTPDAGSDNLAASLAVASRKEGMSRIDHVLLATDASKVFAVQGELQSLHKQVAEVPTVQAIATPIAQSSQAWNQVMEQKAAEQVQQQNRQQDEQQPQQAQPAMSR